MAVDVSISNSELQKALAKFRKFPVEKQKAIRKEIVKTAYEVDKMQKMSLKKHSAREGRNYSAMIAANKVNINYAKAMASIENAHKAAGFFEFGTRPHAIRAKRYNTLFTLSEYSPPKGNNTFTYKGNQFTVFGKEVRHPGTEPKPFFYWPVRKISKKYLDNIRKLL
jgi:hypothetical protein